MLQTLKTAVMNGLIAPRVGDAHALARSVEVSQKQLEVIERGLMLLRALHADISALRLDDSDSFQGTGSCEYGHEGVDVTLEWPNLAVLTDEIKTLLDEFDAIGKRMYWFVYFGDCLTPFRCEAADRVEALALFRDAFPGVPALCAVPANEFGGQVHHEYGADDMVHCPKCSSRTEFAELPRPGWQVHDCLDCNHSFIAVPDDKDADLAPAATSQPQAGSTPVAEGVREVIADIAFTAGNLLAKGELKVSNSRELMGSIIDWAQAFEDVFDHAKHSDDYLDLIDDYARYCLLGFDEPAKQLLATMKG